MEGLSQDNKLKIADGLRRDHRIDAHPVMEKLRQEGPADYEDILQLVASNLGLEEVAANAGEQNLWLLRNINAFSIDYLLEFLRSAVNRSDRDLAVLAITRLDHHPREELVQKSKSVKFLLGHAERTLGLLSIIETEMVNLLRLVNSAVDVDFG